MVLPLRRSTIPIDIKQTASQRSEPSSRSLLMGEHPHPWHLLQHQDRKSRHRCSKPRRRSTLTIKHHKKGANKYMSSRARQLCYPRSNFLVNTNPQSRRIDGSLDLTFVTEIDLVTIPVRHAFALALYTGFLTRLSIPLGAIDTFSTACHPSQTVHQQVSHIL